MDRRKEMIWECVSMELEALREFISSNNEHLEITGDTPPGRDRWRQIVIAAEIQFYMIEHITDLLSAIRGEPMTYVLNAFDLMKEAQERNSPPSAQQTESEQA